MVNMLNQRQIKILLEFCEQPGSFLTGNYFAQKLGVSLRTVQGDMRAIRSELEEETCARLISKTSHGSCIIIEEEDEFSAFVNSLYQQYTTVSLSYPVSRISKMLLTLLNRHRAISLYEMEEIFYISHSTVLNDLKKVEEILEKYNLELLRGNNKVMIDGAEINKRRCLSEQDLYLAHIKNEHGGLYVDERQLAKIKNILTDAMVKYQYHIVDADFNNAILFINVMICRMVDGFYIQPNEIGEVDNLGKEYDISREVFEGIASRFFVKILDEEVRYFALYLRGKGNFSNSATITPEMDAFILECLEAIRDNLDVDLTDNTNLRITLALHCISLSIRIKYDMQMKNDMLDYIRKSFPLGYDVGAYFGYLLQKKYGKPVTKDEIALLAIHFYSSLSERELQKPRKKILVISSSKKSMTILLKQKLLQRFSDHISTVDFVDPLNVEEEMLDEYEIFLTTEKGEYFEKGLAMYVNCFPKESDYRNIRLNIDGFKSIDDVTEIFQPELFEVRMCATKEEVLQKICDNAVSNFEVEGLHEQVFQRESIGSTFFSKDIAVPHPMYAVSSDTFVSVFFSKKPVVWDEEGNTVNLIMLLHVGKNNVQAFQMWNYFSKIFASKELVEQLREKPDFEHFIYLIKEALQNGINSSEL